MTERPIVLPLKGEPLETPYDIGKVKWPEIGSLNASNDNTPSDLVAMDNGDGTSTYFLPEGTKGIMLPGTEGLARSGCSHEPISVSSLILLKLPDGKELVRFGHTGNDLEEVPHSDALDRYNMELLGYRHATGSYRPILQALNPEDYAE
jgi:hypothetical protein